MMDCLHSIGFPASSAITTSPKLRTIAAASNASISEVISVCVFLSEHSNGRGAIVFIDARDAAACLSINIDRVVEILSAMQEHLFSPHRVTISSTPRLPRNA